MQGLHTYNISLCQHYHISSAVAAASATSGRLPSMSSFVSRKLSSRRNSSFELDVFDAKRYFSTAVDGDASTFKGYPEPARHQKAAAEKKSFGTSSSGSTPAKGKGSTCNYKKCTTKKPTSPGLRLASFINSLFQQAASKRKPKSLVPNTATASQRSRSNEAAYSCVSSGFTITPCLRFNTRSNVYKEKSRCRSNTNQYRKEPEEEAAYRPYAKNGVWPLKEDMYVPRGTDHGLYGNVYDGDHQTVCGERRRRVMNNIHKYSDDHHGYLMKRDWSWVGGSTPPRQRKSFKRREDQVEEHCGDQDWESDSSSDLFELKIDNSDLGRHGRSGCLPVFGTTNMEAFKRGIAIATTVAS